MYSSKNPTGRKRSKSSIGPTRKRNRSSSSISSNQQKQLQKNQRQKAQSFNNGVVVKSTNWNETEFKQIKRECSILQSGFKKHKSHSVIRIKPRGSFRPKKVPKKVPKKSKSRYTI